MGGVLPHSLTLKVTQMLNAIRSALINMLGGKVVQKQITEAAPVHNFGHGRTSGRPVYNTQPTEVIKGYMTPADLSDLVSEWSKSSIANQASWIALASAWQLFDKEMSKTPDRRNLQAVEAALDKFHAWNAVSPRPYDESGIEEQIIKMSMKPVTKGNKETDAIRARIRGVSIQIFQQERERLERLRQATSVERIKSFLSMCNNCPNCDGNYHISVQQIVKKLEDTCMFLADPARRFDDIWATSEILLIEGDIATVKQMCGRNNENREDFVDGILTSDYMMKHATINTENNRGKTGEASKNPDVVSDKQQFEDWLAAKHAA